MILNTRNQCVVREATWPVSQSVRALALAGVGAQCQGRLSHSS
jgi:hypothetical protein